MVYAQAENRVTGINPTSLWSFACVDFTAVNNLREIIFEKIASFFLASYTGPCEKGIKLLVLLVLVGCGKDNTDTSQPRENFNANASARPELNVFETPVFGSRQIR